jgi:small subunit ribosomal protein S1
MSQNDPTATKPSDSSAVDAASSGADAITNPASPSPAPSNHETAHAAAPAPAPAADEGDDGEEGDEAAGEGTEGGSAGAEGAPGTEGGAPAKRKRRRRRKKKPGEVGAAVGGEAGAAHAGGEHQREHPHPRPEGWVEGDLHPMGPPRPPRPPQERPAKKERPERERPAFNVGDVVFGKVLEVTEDALFADLSGKAKAIFDLRELLITEEEAEEYNRAHKADRKAAQADPEEAAHAAAERAEAAAAAGGAGAESEAVTVEGAPATKDEAEVAAPPTEVSPGQAAAGEPATATETSTSEAAPAAAPHAPAPPAPAESSPSVEGADEPKAPQLPRVILEPGAPFVGLVHNDGGRGGLVVLTHHPKRVSKAKPMVAEASRTGALVFGLVTGTIKGGVEVDVDGLRAFAPASHVDLRPGSDLSHLVGKRLAFAVTQYAKRGRDVVLSRRALLESEYKANREEALKNIKFGEVVTGVVRTVVPFGAFIDIGGVEGLVPLSEMSHNRADGPKDVFKVNETVKVRVLRVDEKGKLWLSRKSAIDDPWGEVAQKYAQGTRHKGKVVRLQPFGAFVELENGIDGLIHSADLSIKRIEHPEEVVKIGDEIDVVVSQVDSRQHRIALHPAPAGEAANEEPQKIVLGKMVKVVVVVVEAGGLVVRVKGATGRNARGFISAMATGTPRGTELRKLFPVGKELEVKIIEMDPRRGEVKLSIKALNEETERNAYQTYRAQVKREAKFGTLADLLAKRNITPSK